MSQYPYIIEWYNQTTYQTISLPNGSTAYQPIQTEIKIYQISATQTATYSSIDN